jgi:hypothetical protein
VRKQQHSVRTDVSGEDTVSATPASPRNFSSSLVRAMRTWQRTFATSVARLNSNAAGRSGGTTVLRCSEILRKSQAGSSSYENQEIKINGFVRSVRKQKRFAFAEITDGSTIEPLQAFLKPAQAAEYVESRYNGLDMAA